MVAIRECRRKQRSKEGMEKEGGGQMRWLEIRGKKSRERGMDGSQRMWKHKREMGQLTCKPACCYNKRQMGQQTCKPACCYNKRLMGQQTCKPACCYNKREMGQQTCKPACYNKRGFRILIKNLMLIVKFKAMRDTANPELKLSIHSYYPV